MTPPRKKEQAIGGPRPKNELGPPSVQRGPKGRERHRGRVARQGTDQVDVGGHAQRGAEG